MVVACAVQVLAQEGGGNRYVPPWPRACPGMAAMPDDLAAELESWVIPEFPRAAPADGENDVEVEITVDNATGGVRGVLPKSGDEPYREAAWRAIYGWRFKPSPKLGGQARIGITICFHRGSVSIAGVAQVVPGSYTGSVIARWRKVDRSGQPHPGTIDWALAVDKARRTARGKPGSADALRGAYDQLFSLLGDCASCRKREYPLLKDALRHYFNDQAAINEVAEEELADDAAGYPGGGSDPKAPCEECRAAWKIGQGSPTVDELRSYMDRCRAALDRCPDRDRLWWPLFAAYGRFGARPDANVKAAIELLLSLHPPPCLEPGLLLALSAEVAASDPARSLKLEIDAIHHPEFPGGGPRAGAADLIVKAERRGDFETALYLMLLGGPPLVTCGNDSTSFPRYNFLITYYKVRFGLDREYQWLRLLDQIPATADAPLAAEMHQPEYLDRTVAAARALGQEESLAARLEALRESYASLKTTQPAISPLWPSGRSPREIEMMLAGYLAELK